MKHSARKTALGALVAIGLSVLVLEGCQGPGPLRDAASSSDGSEHRLTTEEGRLRAVGGCDYGYTVYRTDAADAPVDLVLAHGFLRDREHMAGLASALADAGLSTVTLDLCNMRPWNGGHRENAVEMRRVAAQFAGPRTLYAGFSAGGLAAVLAAAQDPNAAGVLALDLVDQAGMGREAAARLTAPIIGLFGDASSCNADLNGLEVITTAAQGEVIRIRGATHCDFESPTDGLCRLVCAPEGRVETAETERRAEIIERAVDAAQKLMSSAERTAAAR
jgi:pimeloyl-ACP methyl ester carboxylesterase